MNTEMTLPPKRTVDLEVLDNKTKVLTKVAQSLEKWILIAKENGVDTTKQQDNINLFIRQSPESPGSNFEREVILTQQIFLGKLYCNTVIRKIIEKVIEEKLKCINLISTNHELINFYKERLTECIPPKKCTSEIFLVESKFQEAIKILQLMQDEIARDNKGITSYNLFDRCSY